MAAAVMPKVVTEVAVGVGVAVVVEIVVLEAETGMAEMALEVAVGMVDAAWETKMVAGGGGGSNGSAGGNAMEAVLVATAA